MHWLGSLWAEAAIATLLIALSALLAWWLELILFDKPSQKDTKPTGPQYTANHSSDKTDPVLSAEVEALHTLVNEYKARDSQSYRLQRWNFWVACGTIVGIFAYTTVTVFHWCAMLAANQNAEHALEVTQRAYVNVTVVSLGRPFTVGTVPEAIAKYKNSGLTPASHIWVGTSSGFWQTRLPTELQQSLGRLNCAAKKLVGGILPPQIDDSISTDMSKEIGIPLPPSINAPLDIGTWTSVKGTTEWWFVVVYIFYDDQFGHCHESREPFIYNPVRNGFERMRQGFAQADAACQHQDCQ